jgi:Tripartite tricarboxylate transporter family receptor
MIRRQSTLPHRKITRRSLLVGATAGAFVAAAGKAGAQSYPKGPVKIIVGVGPGSSPDVICRIIADHLSRLWRQQVIVFNQPGGGGAISIRAAGNSVPDGHTLFMSLASNYVALPELEASFPFDVAHDYADRGDPGAGSEYAGRSDCAREALARRTQYCSGQPRQHPASDGGMAAQQNRHRSHNRKLSGAAAGRWPICWAAGCISRSMPFRALQV